MRQCQVMFGEQRGAQICALVEAATGRACPCTSGRSCPLGGGAAPRSVLFELSGPGCEHHARGLAGGTLEVGQQVAVGVDRGGDLLVP